MKITRHFARLIALWGLVVVLWAPAALANPPDVHKKVSNADKNSDLNKEVGLVDLYLTSAINNAKFLSTVADAANGPNDKAIVAEARKNLETAIDKGLEHTDKLKSRKSDLAMAAGVDRAAGESDRQNMGGAASTDDAKSTAPKADTGKVPGGSASMASLDDLERQLRNARTAAKKLTAAQPADLSTAIDGVATHLMGADTAFRAIAKWTNYTRLANTNLSTVPVRGDELPTGGVKRDLDREKGAATPGMTTPGEDRNLPPAGTIHDQTAPGTMVPHTSNPGMTAPGAASPDMAPGTRPGTTNPPINEPVQTAPGTGSPATGQPAK